MIDELLKKGGWVRTLIYSLAGLFVALMIFQAGIYTGYQKAKFSYGVGNMYYRAFDRDDEPERHQFFTAHAAAGKILSFDFPLLLVEGPDQVEKTIRLSSDTQIRRFRDIASTTDLSPDTFVVVIGDPNDSAEVDAKLIRILPPPPDRN